MKKESKYKNESYKSLLKKASERLKKKGAFKKGGKRK